MGSFPENMNEYRKQLQKGAIQQAYKGLMDYFMDLKAYFKNKYPDYYVSGSIYFGYMDMTYFSFFPESLKQRNLKIAVFLFTKPSGLRSGWQRKQNGSNRILAVDKKQ